jgi:hypothetical protein
VRWWRDHELARAIEFQIGSQPLPGLRRRAAAPGVLRRDRLRSSTGQLDIDLNGTRHSITPTHGNPDPTKMLWRTPLYLTLKEDSTRKERYEACENEPTNCLPIRNPPIPRVFRQGAGPSVRISRGVPPAPRFLLLERVAAGGSLRRELTRCVIHAKKPSGREPRTASVPL